MVIATNQSEEIAADGGLGLGRVSASTLMTSVSADTTVVLEEVREQRLCCRLGQRGGSCVLRKQRKS